MDIVDELDIQLFVYLDEIRDKYNISIQDWAKASNMPIPRISELRALAGGRRLDRVLSMKKLSRLGNGLYNLLGGIALKREAEEKLKRITDPKDRILFLAALVPAKNKKFLNQIEKMLISEIR